MEGEPTLNPAQQEILDRLGSTRDERPRFDAALRHQLRRQLDDGLHDLQTRVDPDEPCFVSKYLLSQVMGCERRFMAEQEQPFAWSVPIARGSVVHKAIELSIHWRGQPEPLDLVDEAMARLTEGVDGLADWLQASSNLERAELRAEANDLVTKFLETWPPLKARWRPVTESKLRLELHDRFVCSGKVDLTLGHAEGDQAGKVLIDLKTGGTSPHHMADLRFYALLETIRVGTPPRLLATYYLDQGRFLPEPVTEDLLFSAVDRTIAGITRLVELRYDRRPPTTTPSRGCRWCIAAPDCADGQRFLADDDYDD